MKTRLESPGARRRGARGQALIITVLMMLVVVVTMFLTFSIGARTRRKIHLQAAADATAYSLAVAEARAFNFYAWSNRAIVAHNVSILSVHAHTTYLTFYEDVLAATANNFRRMADRSSGDVRTAMLRIARLYLNSDIDIQTKKRCEWMPDPNNPGKDICRIDDKCSEEKDCNLEWVNGLRGARFFHDQWHAKDQTNTCHKLVQGSRDHFNKVELLRSYQLGVEGQLRRMMSATYAPMKAASQVPLLEASTQPKMYGRIAKRINGDGSPGEPGMPRRSLPQLMLDLTAPELLSQEGAERASVDAYDRAVDNGLVGNRHKDYDEILAGTRFPDFISQRTFQGGVNWRKLDIAANNRAGGLGNPVTRVTQRGTTRLIKVRDAGEDPGEFNNQPGPLKDRWPPVYSNQPLPPVGTPLPPVFPVPSTAPLSGRKLSQFAHRGGHNSVGFGEGDGLASEDHGYVESWFAGQYERTWIAAGRNAVWSDPHDFRRTNYSSTHSYHIWHGDLGKVNAHGQGFGECNEGDPGCEGAQRGYYRGHMRFKLTSDADNLWNMPRTLTFITRPVEKDWPWEFNFEVELPTKVTFSTTQSVGDRWADDTMAAFAGGLVYFHKPNYAGDQYREPPNFWNPFWRAKLHPVRQADAMRAAQGDGSRNRNTSGHPATFRVLQSLAGWSAYNY
jgi:hypothetical protein